MLTKLTRAGQEIVGVNCLWCPTRFMHFLGGMPLVCVLDQGTSSSRVIIFSNGKVIAKAEKKHATTRLCAVELIQEIWSLLEEIADELHEKSIEIKEIEFLAIANQRETALAWNKQTGLPLHEAITWKEQERGAEFLDSFHGIGEQVYKKTGLPLSVTFSALKWKHILARVSEEPKNIALGTVDSWILFVSLLFCLFL
jgi:glycerol kinase